MKYTVIFYSDNKGKSPVYDYINKLPKKVKSKSLKWFQLLEEEGPNLPRPFADVLRDKIREIRVIFASNNYRYLYFFYENFAVITNGFQKKTDKVPIKEIEKAIKFMDDFLNRIKKGDYEL